MFKVSRGQVDRFLTRKIFIYLGLIVGFYFIFVWRLSDLTPGLSPNELIAQNNSGSLGTIIGQPVNLPYNLLQYIFLKIDPNSFVALRLPGAAFAVIFSLTFYRLASGWFSRWIGLFSTLLFASLPFFVISSRQGSGEIMYFMPILFMWLYWQLSKKPKQSNWLWAALIVLSALCIYIPGMLWWLAGAYFVCRRQLNEITTELSVKFSVAGLALATLIIIPLISSVIGKVNNVKMVLALPAMLASPVDILKHIGWMFLSLFVKTGSDSPLILGRTPILNILILALIFFGAYAMRAAATVKTIGLAASILLAILLAGINDNVSILALGLPAALLLASAGLRYLYVEWRAIFPRNPLAKSFALTLIALVAVTQVYYGLRYSLVAWPNSQTVKHLYVLK